MQKDKILVIGAGGQIGVELTLALRRQYGGSAVIAADLRGEHELLKGTGPYMLLDVLDRRLLYDIAHNQKVTQIYLLAAVLSAKGESDPLMAWDVNMQSLLSVLEIGRQEKLHKIYWPSSIAVFGHSSPIINCPQDTIIQPSTVYGISKFAGENWCAYYHAKWGLDVRSLRYPGLISYQSVPGGGTTDYAVDIFHAAVKDNRYTSFLRQNSRLPMMYMPDAIRATVELMEAPVDQIKTRHAYNISAMNFTPAELAKAIQLHSPGFTIDYEPDWRQGIADSWPQSIDDKQARNDWNWKHRYGIDEMTTDMLSQLQLQLEPSRSVD